MRVKPLAVAMLPLAPLATQAVNVVQSNDDGWAEINIRQFYKSLTDAGFSSIISGPAENQSGRGSLDADPDTVGDDGCQFHSCPGGSPPTGKNESMPRFHYVNSYPVTAMRYGIEKFSKDWFGGKPDIAVAGPNVGSNTGIISQFSGTVGAATEAAKNGIPGIAFSGTTGDQTSWKAPVETYMTVYADLATTVTQALTNSGKPYLPSGIWLNVNFPEVSGSSCTKPSDFKFVLSRIYHAVPFITPDDVDTCNNDGRLPAEGDVMDTDGCYVSISVGVASSKLDAGADKQATVLKKLGSILSCLPS